MSLRASTARYEALSSKDRALTDEEEGEEEDESNETSLNAVSWILGIHFFATALTVTALPSLLLEILNGAEPTPQLRSTPSPTRLPARSSYHDAATLTLRTPD